MASERWHRHFYLLDYSCRILPEIVFHSATKSVTVVLVIVCVVTFFSFALFCYRQAPLFSVVNYCFRLVASIVDALCDWPSKGRESFMDYDSCVSFCGFFLQTKNNNKQRRGAKNKFRN